MTVGDDGDELSVLSRWRGAVCSVCVVAEVAWSTSPAYDDGDGEVLGMCWLRVDQAVLVEEVVGGMCFA